MRKISLSILTTGLLLSVSAWSQTKCDLTADGQVDQADVQAAINMSLGISPCTAAIVGNNICNVLVVQRVINASNGGQCLTSLGIHSVVVTWQPSTSTGVTGYKVYRSTTSGGPYSVAATLGNVSSYMDNSVQSGLTYYYVITALGNGESNYSTQTQALIPTP